MGKKIKKNDTVKTVPGRLFSVECRWMHMDRERGEGRWEGNMRDQAREGGTGWVGEKTQFGVVEIIF